MCIRISDIIAIKCPSNGELCLKPHQCRGFGGKNCAYKEKQNWDKRWWIGEGQNCTKAILIGLIVGIAILVGTLMYCQCKFYPPYKLIQDIQRVEREVR